MPSQATITSDTGPAVQNTAYVISNVTKVTLDIARKVVQIESVDKPVKEFDLAGVTTLTDSISSDVHTIVIS